MAVADATGDRLGSVVDFARRRPGTVLAWVLGVHLLVWTVLPALVCPNLQLDLVEDLALGKEWQLGYWKHPPLPWWIADLVYRLTGHDRLRLPARPAGGGGLPLWRLAAGARGRR